MPFYLSDAITAATDTRMHNETVCHLFDGFSMHRCTLSLTSGTPNTFVVGTPILPSLGANAEYVVHADEGGLAVIARNIDALMRGYLSLLQKIEYNADGALYVAPFTENGVFKIANRMIHFCIFPENSRLFIRKCIRLAGALQYTHVVLEFWGMLRFDCCAALSWPNAYSKEEAADLIREIREFGMEPIPMFNHLGHASACRLLSGKHVVLDQDPSLYALFTPDGWSWNVDNPQVWALLKAVRGELYELFGQCQYFHAGLDESYMHANHPALYQKLPDFLGRLTQEISREGKRPMIWMDMFLPPEADQGRKSHACTKKTPEDCIAVLSRLSPDTVLIDWQYKDTQPPLPSSLYFKDQGFAIMGAPWYETANGRAHIETVQTSNLFGVMLTTWHTLNAELPSLLTFARYCGAAAAPWSDYSGCREETATLLRKLTWEAHAYEDAGWMKNQIVLGSEKTI